MTTTDFFAQTALLYGQCEIERDIMLYSPEGINALNLKNNDSGEPFAHNEADYWILTSGQIIPMYGAENITDFFNSLKEGRL
ncbi:MAG: hypothetical protein FWG77_04945 [Treponema sp.]|nr:hypothetical protein [Treponema sp.]